MPLSHFKATSEYPLMTKMDPRALPAARAEPQRYTMSMHPTLKPGKYRMCCTSPLAPPLFPFYSSNTEDKRYHCAADVFFAWASSDRSWWRTFEFFSRNPANLGEGSVMKYESLRDSDVSDLLLTCKHANAPQPITPDAQGATLGSLQRQKISCFLFR